MEAAMYVSAGSAYVSVKLLSAFSQHAGKLQNGTARIDPSATVMDLARQLGLPEKYVRIVTVNGRQVDLDHELQPGDDVLYVPPAIGGG